MQLRRASCVTSGDSALAGDLRRVLLPALDNVTQPEARPALPSPPTDGELARAALQILARHPDHHAAIQALVTGPRVEQLATKGTFAAVVIGLVVLQTHVKFEQDSTGHYSFSIEKPSAQDELLKKLVDAVIPRLTQ